MQVSYIYLNRSRIYGDFCNSVIYWDTCICLSIIWMNIVFTMENPGIFLRCSRVALRDTSNIYTHGYLPWSTPAFLRMRNVWGNAFVDFLLFLWHVGYNSLTKYNSLSWLVLYYMYTIYSHHVNLSGLFPFSPDAHVTTLLNNLPGVMGYSALSRQRLNQKPTPPGRHQLF